MKLIVTPLLLSVLVLSTPSPARGATILYTDFAAFQAATTGLTTDDFEAWAFGVTTQPKSSLGVSWTSPEDLFATFFAPTHSGTQSMTAGDSDVVPIPDALNAALPAGVTAVGGWVFYFTSTPVTLSIFDGTQTLLGASNFPILNGYSFLGFTSTDPIAFATFSQATQPDDFVLDDFTFGTAQASAPVPEPATMTLLGLGLAGMAGRRWRQRKAS